MLLLLALVAPSWGFYIKPASNQIEIPSNIFRQFLDYDLIFHFNNKSMINPETILLKSKKYRAFYLINYDLPHEKLLTRPRGYNYINIVTLENPHYFKSYSSKVYNFYQSDFVIFITTKIQEDQIWKISGLQRASATLIYTTAEKRIYYCCYFCGNETAVLKETKTSNLRRLLNNYSNFNGHVFKIAYSDYKPFFWRESNEVLNGAEGRVLYEVSRLHNFKYKLVQFKSRQGKGAWQAMIEAVEANRVDWAVGGLSITLERQKFTDFTRFIKTQGYAIAYAVYYNKWTVFENFLLVFGWSVWIALIFSTIVICFVAKLGNRLEGLKKSYGEYGKILLMSIVEQTALGNQLKFLRLSSLRFLFLIWWLSCLSLTSIYKSELASTLIKPKYNQNNRIDDLVKKNFQFQVSRDWSVLRENLETSSDQNYEKLLKSINSDLGFCEAILALASQKLAAIYEETALQYNVGLNCRVEKNFDLDSSGF